MKNDSARATPKSFSLTLFPRFWRDLQGKPFGSPHHFNRIFLPSLKLTERKRVVVHILDVTAADLNYLVASF